MHATPLPQPNRPLQFLDALSADREVIMVDLRGQGQTQVPAIPSHAHRGEVGCS